MEIERKFLIDAFPKEYPLLEESVVHQGYLAVDPVVRIRSKQSSKKSDYILCFKGEGTLMRQETEIPISYGTFKELEALLKAPMIRKDYKVYELPDGMKLECNLVDEGTTTEFFYAEVEFESLKQAKEFVPPAILKKEVTEDPSYSMGNYWSRKLMGCQ